MLLYCTGSYAAYRLQVPGLGVVLRVDQQHIEYRWILFTTPIPKAHIDTALEHEDAAKLRNIRFDSQWLFSISQQSFTTVINNRAVAWANL